MQEAGRAAAMTTSAQQALAAMRAQPAAGLAGESAAETAARVLAVELEPTGGVTVRVAADGLTLDAKLTIERALKASLQAMAAPTAGVSVYFKRLAAAPGGDRAAAEAGPVRPAGPAPLRDRKAPFGLTIDRRAIPGVTDVIVVASGKGGVGKSTVSANLAVALAAGGLKVGLLDADIYGPSAPLMMGLAGRMPVTDQDRLVPLESHGVKTVSFGFLTDTRQPVIWRGPLIAKAFRQLCYDVRWGDLDVLVVDLPPGTGDVQLALIESVPVRGAVIVTTPQDVALLDAHKALTMFEKLDVPVLGLVENMAHHVCPSCGHVEAVFGEGGGDRMAAERRIPVLARVPLASAVRQHGDSGRPVALDLASPLGQPFAALAQAVRQHCL